MTEELNTKINEELIQNEETSSTITSYKLMRNYSAQLKTMDLSKDSVKDSLYSAIKHVVYNCNDKYFVMMAPDIRYLTIFAKVDDFSGRKDIVKSILQFIIDEHERLGGLKAYDFDDDSVELWIGEEFYKIFPYGFAVEEC